VDTVELDGTVTGHGQRVETIEEKVARLESENEAKDRTIDELRDRLDKIAA